MEIMEEVFFIGIRYQVLDFSCEQRAMSFEKSEVGS